MTSSSPAFSGTQAICWICAPSGSLTTCVELVADAPEATVPSGTMHADVVLT